MALVESFHPSAGEVCVIFQSGRAGKEPKLLAPIHCTRVDIMASQPSCPLDSPAPQCRFRNRIDRAPRNEIHHSRLLPMREAAEMDIDFLRGVKGFEVHRAILGGAVDESRPPTPSGPEAGRPYFGGSQVAEVEKPATRLSL